jgi:quercetin dioxygenase-like cupin family protein
MMLTHRLRSARSALNRRAARIQSPSPLRSSLSRASIRAARRLRAAAFTLLITLCAAPLHHAVAADQPNKLTYWRLYSTPDGSSRWAEEALPLAQSGASTPEERLATYRLGDIKGAIVASLKAGTTEDWHVAPRRQFMFCLRGIVEVTAGDGQKKRVLPGQFVLLEDLTGKGHITHSAGTEDHVALAIPVPDGVPAKK